MGGGEDLGVHSEALMPDLFPLLPALEGAHPSLTGQRVALIGVSVIIR